MNRMLAMAPAGLVLLGSTFFSGLVAVAAQDEGPGAITLGTAITVAVEEAPAAKSFGFAAEASGRRVRSAKAQRLPKLNVTGNLLRWNKPLEAQFGPPGSPPVTVRDQYTSAVNVTLAQPLTALVALSRLVKLEESNAGSARQEAAQARLDAGQRAAESYLRLLQAKAFAKVAEQGLTQVESQLKTAQAFEQAGALSHVDVLRLISARESARQNLLKANTTVAIAKSSLGLSLNLPLAANVDAVDDLPEKPTPMVVDEAAALTQAENARPELALSQARQVQADSAKSIARAALLPNLLAVATYQNTQGQGPFLPQNAWYLGLQLNWDIWDWGKNWNDMKAAEFGKKQSEIGTSLLRDQIAFDVHRRVLETKTAFETLDAAQLALNAAEEAHRIQDVRFKEGAATTTDVIDSESEVSRARNGYAQGRYDYFLAEATLARTLGQLPTSR